MALNFNNLNRHLLEMEEYFPFHTSTNRLISKASVGWHLAHSFKVINGVCTALENSKPEEYRPEFSWPRTLVFTLGSFPRGKAESPEIVKPKGEINLGNLLLEIEHARINLTNFDAFEKNHYGSSLF